MNITLDKGQNNQATLTIALAKSDYQDKVEKVLVDYRKRASVPGFRQGKVPMSYIRNQYEEAIRADEVNRMLQDGLFNYLEKENIDILGQPLPVPGQVDFNSETQEFGFELGLSPEFDLNVSAKVKLPMVSIEIDSKDIDNEVTNLRKRYGQMSEVEKAGADDIFYGNFQMVDKKGQAIEGVEAKEGRFDLASVANRSLKKSLESLAKDGTVSVNAAKHFDKEFDLESRIGMTAPEGTESTGLFEFTLKTIYHLEPSDLNQELFDKVMGEGKVTSEEELREEIRKEMAKVYDRDVDTFFFNKATEHLMKTKMDLPITFLKKWMTQSGEEPLSPEKVEEGWEQTEKAMRWQLIENKLVKDNELQINKEELTAYAIQMVQERMAQFGQPMSDEEAEKMALNLLQDRQQAEQLSEQVLQGKLMNFFKGSFGHKEQKASIADFRKLVEKSNK